MATALQICANAYRQANMNQDLTSFGTSQEYPYNIAVDLLNEVVAEVNRSGDLYCLQASLSLSYTIGNYAYDLDALNVDPRRITSLERTLVAQPGEIQAVNPKTFRLLYRGGAIQTRAPKAYTTYNQILELDSIPDQDYSLKLYYYRELTPATATTDTFQLPDADEDVLRMGVYALLLQRLGRPDFNTAFAMFTARLKGMRAEAKRSSALPKVMPAGF